MNSGRFGSGLSRIFLVVLVSLFLYFLITGTFSQGVHVGREAPIFKLPDIDGGEVDLSGYRGSVVLASFWALWCSQCVDEMPYLTGLAKALEGEKFVILAIQEDGDAGSVRKIRELIGSAGSNFKVLLDRRGEITDAYGVYRIPETFIIDKDGVIIERVDGVVKWDADRFINRFRELSRK